MYVLQSELLKDLTPKVDTHGLMTLFCSWFSTSESNSKGYNEIPVPTVCLTSDTPLPVCSFISG